MGVIMKMQKPSRRDILKMTAMAPAFALSAPAKAALRPPKLGQAPAFHRFDVGQAKITIVSDGQFNMPVTELGVNADPQDVAAFLTRHFQSTETAYRHTNHVFIEIGEAKILVDVGSGTRFVNTVGHLYENLGEAGIDVDEITHVVITHAHPDHIWGIRDDFDEPIFPDAQYFIGGVEMDHWMQDDYVNKAAPEQQQIVLGAVNSLTAEGLEWTIGSDGFEVVPGVTMIDTAGHTQGHMSVLIESDGDSLIALGDAMTNAYMDFEHPEWVIERDEDKDLTVKTRLGLLDRAASDKMAIVGYHFPFPGVGHVAKDGAAYRFIPALWRWNDAG